MHTLFTPTRDLRSRVFPPSPPPRWFTWSTRAREALYLLSDEIPSLPKPTLEYFGPAEYGYSIGCEVRDSISAQLRQHIDSIAMAFHRIRTETGLLLFDNLMDQCIDGNTIRSLFALVRSTLVAKTGDSMVAIYAPLGAVGGTAQGDFPLHADLYPPAYLLNVFDHVPSDGSGASLLLPMEALLRMVDTLPSIPIKVNQRLRELVARPSEVDHYEEFYDLLHGEHPWTAALEGAMADQALRVALSRGQGYLVHDRHWLHGRERPRGRVRKDRLHRLIFDTERTLKARRIEARHAR